MVECSNFPLDEEDCKSCKEYPCSIAKRHFPVYYECIYCGHRHYAFDKVFDEETGRCKKCGTQLESHRK